MPLSLSTDVARSCKTTVVTCLTWPLSVFRGTHALLLLENHTTLVKLYGCNLKEHCSAQSQIDKRLISHTHHKKGSLAFDRENLSHICTYPLFDNDTNMFECTKINMGASDMHGTVPASLNTIQVITVKQWLVHQITSE